MSARRTGPPVGLSVTIAAIAIAAACAGGCCAPPLTGGAGTGAKDAQSTDVTSGAGATASSEPSLTTMCHVRAVDGPTGGVWTVEIDPLEIYSGPEAVAYAASHGMTVPENGILFVDPSDETSTYPLARTALIKAWSGDIMEPTYFEMTPPQLQALARGEEVPGISSPWQDVWEAVVRDGVVTELALALIAD